MIQASWYRLPRVLVPSQSVCQDGVDKGVFIFGCNHSSVQRLETKGWSIFECYTVSGYVGSFHYSLPKKNKKIKRNVNKKYIIMGNSRVIFNKFLKKASG